MSANKPAVARIVDALATKWIVFHKATSLYWRPNACGYTSDLGAAGLFTQEEAERCARRRSPMANGAREDRATSLAEEIAKADDSTIFGMLRALADETPKDAPTGVWLPNPSIVPPWLSEVPDSSGRYAIHDDLQGLFARFDLYNDLPRWFEWQREVLAAIGEGPRPDLNRRRIIDGLRDMRTHMEMHGRSADALDAAIVELFEMPAPGASIRVPQRLHDTLVDALHAAERIDCRYDREFRELRTLLEGKPLPAERSPWAHAVYDLFLRASLPDSSVVLYDDQGRPVTAAELRASYAGDGDLVQHFVAAANRHSVRMLWKLSRPATAAPDRGPNHPGAHDSWTFIDDLRAALTNIAYECDDKHARELADRALMLRPSEEAMRHLDVTQPRVTDSDTLRLLLSDLRDYVGVSADTEREEMEEYAPGEEPAAPGLLARIDALLCGADARSPLQLELAEVAADRDALQQLIVAACEKMHCGGASLLSAIDILWDGLRTQDQIRRQRASVSYSSYAGDDAEALQSAMKIVESGRVAVLNLDGIDRAIVAPLDYGLPVIGPEPVELHEDRSVAPYGYEIWDFYGSDTLDEDGKPMSCWLWRGVGMPDDDGGPGDDTTREQAIAQCWAHRDGIVADARRREPEVLARMVAHCIDDLRAVVGHDVSALAIESRCRAVMESMQRIESRLQHRIQSPDDDVVAKQAEALKKARQQLRCRHTWKTVHGSQGHDIHCYNEICTKCDTFRMCSVESCEHESNDRGYCAEHLRLVPNEAEWFIAQGDARLEIRSDTDLVAVVENAEFATRIIADHNASCARIAISKPASGDQSAGRALLDSPTMEGATPSAAPAAGAEADEARRNADATRVASLISLAADNGLIDNHNAREVDAALCRLLGRSFKWDPTARTVQRVKEQTSNDIGSSEHCEFWAAVNEYAAACGGSIGASSSGRRMNAVVRVEEAAKHWPVSSRDPALTREAIILLQRRIAHAINEYREENGTIAPRAIVDILSRLRAGVLVADESGDEQ